MARRNPMNERYAKNTAPAGKTRKSAAAAKPKRPDATGSSTRSKGSSAGKAKAAAPRRQLAVHPPTPEYRFWRRVWLGLMVVAMALVGASFWLMQRNRREGTWVLIATYAILGVAVFLDFFKLRKLREEWLKSGGATEAKHDAKADAPKSDAKTDSAESSSASKSE